MIQINSTDSFNKYHNFVNCGLGLGLGLKLPDRDFGLKPSGFELEVSDSGLALEPSSLGLDPSVLGCYNSDITSCVSYCAYV